MRVKGSRQLLFEYSGIVLLSGGIFVLDLINPVGVATWLLYLLPLSLTFLVSDYRAPLYFSLGASALTLISLVFTSGEAPVPFDALNRVIGISAMWGFAFVASRYKRTQVALTSAEARREKVMDELSAEVMKRQEAEGKRAIAVAGLEEATHGEAMALAGRRRAEEKMLTSKMRLEAIVDSAMDAIISIDEHLDIVLFNRAAEHMFQCKTEEALGHPLDRFIPEQFRVKHQKHIKAFGESGITSRKMGSLGTITGVRANGEVFPIEAAISQIGIDGDRFYTVILRDIGERKKLEEQLRRTERLAELGTIASGMAHEIGTPMNVILGRAEYLMKRTQEDTMKRGLGTIIGQVERITRVMNQLLSFARRRAPERRAVDLRQVVESSMEMFQERLARQHILVELIFDDEVPPVHADADQMSQVVINLVMNATHAMPDGGTLHIGLSADNDTVILKVMDSGYGVPPDTISRIFDPFFTTKDFGKGTGLGLTVVKGIVDEHGGSIAVESKEGKGATFTMHMPVYHSHEKD